jgi:AraC-like DNA-binding protein
MASDTARAATLDFSDRYAPLYVTLGAGSTRRSVRQDRDVTAVEAFLGERIHGFTTIARIERGSGVVRGAFGVIEIGTGDVLVLPPGRVSYAFNGPRRVETVAVRAALEAGVVARAADLPANLFDRSDAALIDVLARAPARRHVTRVDGERIALRALAEIDARPAAARLAPIAHDLGYTADGLSALLRRHTGRGFAQWRDAVLMAGARTLLIEAETAVGAARKLALEPNYLHRRFTLAHGMTPGQWRRTRRLPLRAAAHEWDALVHYFQNFQTSERIGSAAAALP